MRVYQFITPIIMALSLCLLSACEQGATRQDNAEKIPEKQDVGVEVVAKENSGMSETTQLGNDNAQSSLAYLGWEADTSADVPRVCFNFYSPLLSGDNVALRDYVDVEPKASFSVNASGNALCVTGFSFDQDYTVTLKEGLPGANSLSLARDFKETVSFGNKPAFVSFAGDGIILPRVGAQGLAIETVNVDRITIEIARVSDRMIARRSPQSGEATLEGDYSWEYEDAAKNIRDVVWTGDVPVKNVVNATVTTVVPITELAGKLDPGAYVVTAERAHDADEDRIARAWRWIISTDLALTAYHGDAGLDVTVRSIDTAKVQSGVEVVLVAKNNDVLTRLRTSGQGHVAIPASLMNGKGPKAAHMLMAYGKGEDFAVLDLSRAPLDLSEHDISGREVSKAVDLYAYTERGVYRPGETAHITAILRGTEGNAVLDRPVNLQVKQPNGITQFNHRVEAKDIKKSSGTIVWNYEIPTSAPRGLWSVDVLADGVGNIGSVTFSVEDFVPQKLAVNIKVDETPLNTREVRPVTVDAQFLYGAPGAALEGEAEARIRIDTNPFPELSDYKFGPADRDFSEQFIDVGGGMTDGKGLLNLALDLSKNAIDSPWPLRAEITAGVSEPGGRYVKESTRVPVRTATGYLGIKPLYQGSRAPRGEPVQFNLVAVDRLGAREAQSVQWTLVEEDWDYHWYRENGSWRYRREVRDIPVTNGTIQIEDDAPALWERQLSWGDYRLELTGAEGVTSSYRYSVGWGQAERSDSPDQIRIGTSQTDLKPGENVTLAINAPYAGEGELVIANDRVRMIKPISLTQGASDITFPFSKEWGGSVYALVTLYTPRDTTARPVPRRAVGVSYISADQSMKVLNLEIQSPEVIRPRTDHEFIVDVDNVPSGETAWLNLAVVDEGILRLTKYKSPDASGYYFGKKALGVTLHDDYGRILNANLGDPAIARSGGDSLGGEGLTVVPTKTVSLFSGPIKVSGGQAKVTLAMPDFNGELRLMATAWSQSAVGSDASSVKLRDKVPAIVALPRFLAPGDRAFATVSLDNVEGQAGAYEAILSSETALSADANLTMTLASGQRLDQRTQLIASETGVDNIKIDITGPDNFGVSSTYPIEVRSAFLPVTRTNYTMIEPGSELTLTPDIIDDLVAASVDVNVSFTRLPGLDPTPYVQSLTRYPYGCTEQTVSTSMPLLYAKELGGIPGQSETERRRNLQKSVARLASRQSRDGAFGMWREGDRNATPWLGVYATDFMLRAKSEGLYVPDDVLSRATNAISEISRMPRYPNLQYRFNGVDRDTDQLKAEAAAYAHFVLAKNEKGNLGQMRYLFDNHRDKMRSPLAYAYLGGALKLMGDQSRAKRAFAEGVKRVGYDDQDNYYQSPIRDLAGVLTVASESGDDSLSVSLSSNFRDEIVDATNLNTQEKAYTVLALRSLIRASKVPSVRAEDAALTKSDYKQSAEFNGTNLVNFPTFTSRDEAPFWAAITVSGSPKVAPQASANGFTIEKTVFDMTGKSLKDDSVRQGDRFIVKVAFNSTINQSRTMVLADLLPAGFEIETVLRPQDGARQDGRNPGPYVWIGDISDFDVIEARDDRLIASLETYRKDKYVAAYIVRAVTAGDFVQPGAVVEDMYRPEDQARTPSLRVRVLSDPNL